MNYIYVANDGGFDEVIFDEIKVLQALHDTPFWHKKISMLLPDLIKSTNNFARY